MQRGNGGTQSLLFSMTCTDRQGARFQNLCTQLRVNFTMKGKLGHLPVKNCTK